MPPRWDYFSGRPLFYTDVVPTELKIPECPQLPKSAQSVSSAIQTRTGLTQCAVMHVAWINGIQVSVWHEPGASTPQNCATTNHTAFEKHMYFRDVSVCVRSPTRI